jgi:hypothetical protein
METGCVCVVCYSSARPSYHTFEWRRGVTRQNAGEGGWRAGGLPGPTEQGGLLDRRRAVRARTRLSRCGSTRMFTGSTPLSPGDGGSGKRNRVILKWGRNAATKVPPRLKNGGASVYRKSTSLECLVRAADHKQHIPRLLSPPAALAARWTAWQREIERARGKWEAREREALQKKSVLRTKALGTSQASATQQQGSLRQALKFFLT